MPRNKKNAMSPAVGEVHEDVVHQGRDQHFMTLDSWNRDGNYQARYDEFGPEMEQEEPPTLNGEPL